MIKTLVKSVSLVVFGAMLFFSPMSASAIDCPSGFTKKDQICVPNNPFQNGGGLASTEKPENAIVQAIKILLSVSGAIAVLFIIIGGLRMITARGNATAVTAARKTVGNAVIGIIVITLSYVIVLIVSNVLKNPTP